MAPASRASRDDRCSGNIRRRGDDEPHFRVGPRVKRDHVLRRSLEGQAAQQCEAAREVQREEDEGSDRQAEAETRVVDGQHAARDADGCEQRMYRLPAGADPEGLRLHPAPPEAAQLGREHPRAPPFGVATGAAALDRGDPLEYGHGVHRRRTLLGGAPSADGRVAAMDAAELAFAGAFSQAKMLAAREISASELVELYLARIAELDPQLNAFRVVLGDEALAEAADRQARLDAGESGPLLGVPIAIKDDVDVAGQVTAWGTVRTGLRSSRTARSSAACARPARS